MVPVNMRELASKLRVSRQTVANWIARMEDFPVAQRGSNGREYTFDAGAVISFLGTRREAEAREAAARGKDLDQFALPMELDELPNMPGASIRDRIDLMKLRKLQREENERCAELVQAKEVGRMASDMLLRFRPMLQVAAETVGREQNLPAAVVDVLQARLGAVVAQGVASLLADLGHASGREVEPILG